MIWWKPPCKVITLVLYIWINLICWLVWLSLSFASLVKMRVFVRHQRLLARWPGFLISFFYLLILDKSSSVLLFLAGRLVGTAAGLWFVGPALGAAAGLGRLFVGGAVLLVYGDF